MVVFADGQSNEESAIAAAMAASESGMYVHTIGLGSGVDAELLGGIAEIGEGMYFHIRNNTDEEIYLPQLERAFASIASSAVSHMLIQ